MIRGVGTRSASSVLVVAGEPSGDRIAAGVARALSADGVRCFGMGGDACALAGVRVVADLRASAAMGMTEVAARLPAVLAAYVRLARLVESERPRAAVLVDYAEFNQRLGRLLRGLGIPVLRCVAPQVWAWRPGRLATAGRAFDRLALILPFEEPLWRGVGVDARYVGHPVLDVVPRDRTDARQKLGLSGDRPAIALLPGSRRHEVRSLASRMLETVKELGRLGRGVEARLVVAPSLDESTRHWLREQATRAAVRTVDVTGDFGAAEWLAAFDASLAASGTATLESALCGAPPVIVYRVSAITAAIARRLIRVPAIGLPNLVLGSRCYPELLQDDVEPRRMALAICGILDAPSTFEPLARRLRKELEPPRSSARTSSERIAAWMNDWLRLPNEHTADLGRPRAESA